MKEDLDLWSWGELTPAEMKELAQVQPAAAVAGAQPPHPEYRALQYRKACLDPRDFGAVEGNAAAAAGDQWQRNTAAIQAAIDTDGAECVAIAGGDFVTSDLVISSKSNFTFRIEFGSRLLTAVNRTTSAVLNVSRVTNVTLEGSGVVHGSAEHYISYYSPPDDRFEPTAPDGTRPNLLIIEESHLVVVRDLHFHNSSEKNIIVRASSDVTIDNVEIYSDRLNYDPQINPKLTPN